MTMHDERDARQETRNTEPIREPTQPLQRRRLDAGEACGAARQSSRSIDGRAAGAAGRRHRRRLEHRARRRGARPRGGRARSSSCLLADQADRCDVRLGDLIEVTFGGWRRRRQPRKSMRPTCPAVVSSRRCGVVDLAVGVRCAVQFVERFPDPRHASPASAPSSVWINRRPGGASTSERVVVAGRAGDHDPIRAHPRPARRAGSGRLCSTCCRRPIRNRFACQRSRLRRQLDTTAEWSASAATSRAPPAAPSASNPVHLDQASHCRRRTRAAWRERRVRSVRRRGPRLGRPALDPTRGRQAPAAQAATSRAATAPKVEVATPRAATADSGKTDQPAAKRRRRRECQVWQTVITTAAVITVGSTGTTPRPRRSPSVLERRPLAVHRPRGPTPTTAATTAPSERVARADPEPASADRGGDRSSPRREHQQIDRLPPPSRNIGRLRMKRCRGRPETPAADGPPGSSRAAAIVAPADTTLITSPGAGPRTAARPSPSRTARDAHRPLRWDRPDGVRTARQND